MTKDGSGKIRIPLTGPENIYSNFDENTLSKNLVEELKRQAADSEFSTVEFVVKKSAGKGIGKVEKHLQEYFSGKEECIRKDRWLKRFKGTAYVAFGGLLLVAQKNTFSTGIVGMLLVPAGWFAIFLGVEHIISDWKLRSIHRVLEKLKNATYCFSRK
ncbi:MAG: hypothetical protein ABIG39_03085 [Candidatus Micrarchaeota archaeon]